ncbi:MAG: M2 family metallopeptidase, partial [Thermoguttaceae bacterium]
MNSEANQLSDILEQYQTEVLQLFKECNESEWDAMTTGKPEAFERSAKTKIELAKYHSNAEKYAEMKKLRNSATGLSALQLRSVDRMIMAFEQKQLPPDLLEKMEEMASKIQMTFQTHRGTLDGKEYSNNDLLEMLSKETDSEKRKKVWEALKQVGGAIDADVIALAKIRNEAAQKLGFPNYWEMQIHFQEYDSKELLALFDELEKTTTPLFATMKNELDAQQSEKFGVSIAELRPWHYDNPFFQQAPPSKEINPNDFYNDKTKEEIVDIAVRYFNKIGLPFDKVLQRSDMYERDGKNQHAFSIDMDTLGDVRNLCNVK